MDSAKYELELTDELLKKAKKFAYKEAGRCCPKYLSRDDAVQEALMELFRKPLDFDPTKETKPTTLVYLVVRRKMMTYIMRESQRRTNKPILFMDIEQLSERAESKAQSKNSIDKTANFRGTNWTVDDMLEFIDDQGSRAMCRSVIKNNGNVSKAARELEIPPSTVRDRVKALAPKLITAGFNPYRAGVFDDDSGQGRPAVHRVRCRDRGVCYSEAAACFGHGLWWWNHVGGSLGPCGDRPRWA